MEFSITALELETLISFLDEALEHLEGIEKNILQLENSQDLDLVNSIFRPVHTIKGTASFLGLNDIKDLSHEMETLLDDLRNEKITVSAELIDALLDGVDTLAKMLLTIQAGIQTSDRANDPVLITVEDVEFQEIIDEISLLNADNAPASLLPDSVEKPTPLLTRQELKAIVYPMDVDSAFVQESREHIDSLEQSLLDLEKAPENFDFYNDIFRDMHSLKGGAGLLVSVVTPEEKRQRHPIMVFGSLAHAAENLVQKARDEKKVLSDSTIEILLNVVDRLKLILDGFVNHDASQALADDLIAACGGKVDVPEPGTTCKSPDKVPNKVNTAQILAMGNILNQSLSAIKAGIEEVSIDEKRKGSLGKIIRALNTIIKVNGKLEIPGIEEALNALLNTAKSLSQNQDETDEDLIASLAASFKPVEDAILDQLQDIQSDARSSNTDDLPSKASEKKGTPPGRSDANPAPVTASIIKVPQERLDILMNLVGELIVSKNHFPALSREIIVDHNLSKIGKKVKSAGDQVGRITDELQNIVMKMRMLPVGTVFSRFKRLVRDLAKKLNKKIVLKLSGEETELDKTIIEALGDPMVHLIRNCADHALEGVEERKKQGKPAQGLIHLKAYNQGQNVIIEIIDDGRGIDPDNIRVKAVEKGYLSLEELEKLDDRAVQNLIFRPGFSGAKEVSEVSGRGVGMDVVRTNVENIGGTVTFTSKKGVGTTFVITLPLTLAISKGLEVKANGSHYYLPLDYISEAVKLSPDLVRSHRNMRMAVIRNSLLPVFSLAAILNHSRVNDFENTAPNDTGVTVNGDQGNKDELSMVVLNMNGIKVALEVDRFYTESEYVIKPLSGALSKIRGYTGATITSSGEVILILDPLKLF